MTSSYSYLQCMMEADVIVGKYLAWVGFEKD